jgi:hypothetical protein
VLGGTTAKQAATTTVHACSSIACWQSLAPMSTARESFAAVTAPDGRIYAIGGGNADGTTASSVEAYSPKSDSWAPIAPLNTARRRLAASLGADGRIYAIGGCPAYNCMVPTGAVEAYGPTLTVPAATPQRNSSFTLSGDNFASGALVRITMDGKLIALATTDSAGALLPLMITAPNVAGNHLLSAIDEKSGYPATVELFVN